MLFSGIFPFRRTHRIQRRVASRSARIALALIAFLAAAPGCSSDDDDDVGEFLTLALAGGFSRIYIFSDANGGGGHNGGLGGRNGADSICLQRKLEFSSLFCTNVHAFLSVDASDSIATMPDNYGVPQDRIIESPGRATVGANWADLLDGQLSDTGSFRSAGLFVDVASNPPYFWTGSASSDGSVGSTCDGWNNGASGQGDALAGSQNAGFSNTTLLNCLDQTDPSGTPKSIVCLCW